MSLTYVVIDDHLAVRQLLVQGLRLAFAEMVCVGEVAAGHEGLVVCLANKPDLLFLDIDLPVLSGVEVVRHLRPLLPELKIICFSGTGNPEKLSELKAHRIEGFVSKGASLEELIDAVKTVAEGGTWFDPLYRQESKNERPAAGTSGPPMLTLREKEVLQLVARSKTTKEIASTLFLSPKTVEKHRSTLMHKLKVRDAAGITRYALRHGLVNSD